MSEWKEYKLSEITEPIKETYNPIGKNELFYIGLEHIEQESLRLNSIGVSSDVTSNKFKFKPNDILFGKLRPYFRKVVKPIFSGICSTDIWVFRSKNEFDQNFLYYFLANWEFVNTANGADTGTRMPRADWNFLKDTEWLLPVDKNEQIAIAEVLSSLDDKIDLLHRQNKTLEQLAETLFRQWFVEEAEEDWKVDILGNVFDIGIGRTPPRKEQHWFTTNPKDVKWISIKDMGLSGIYIDSVSEYLTEEAIQYFNIPIIPKNTVILSFKMTIGRIAITTERMLSNEAIAHFKKKKDSNLFPEYLYLFLKTYRFEQLGSTSSIVEAINSQMIKEMEILIPDDKRLIDFDKLIRSIFDKIKITQIQIRTLTQLRDTLLPKLMRGEVSMKLNENEKYPRTRLQRS
jgi:type I restriction enzyme S subunit